VAITLTVVAGPHQGREFVFGGHDTFLVGRSKRAHFQLADKDRYFSRFHFLIEANLPACKLLDMGSRNGTHVNGAKVASADLKDGDEIRAGHTTLRVRIRPDEESPPPPVRMESHPDNPLGEEKDSETLLNLPSPSPVRANAISGDGPPYPMAIPVSPPPPPKMANAVSSTGPFVNRTAPEKEGVPLANLFPHVPGFVIESELGRGGMGVVYRARREADGSVLALKTVIPAVAASRKSVAKFRREADILRKLSHPNIVSLREIGEAGDLLYFAMDFVQGVDVARLVKEQGPLSARMAVRLVCQVLEGLEHAHAVGFVHRDIKPANVLLADENGQKRVKVADFGLARAYQASALSGLTLSGDVGGTVPFMAPEQISRFREAKPPADQYAAAAMLYYLLTRRLVYDFDSSPLQPLVLILQEEPVPLLSRRADLPAELAAAVHKALAREPEERFNDVAAFRAALAPFGR
jgi:serine/threonine-protein kinase